MQDWPIPDCPQYEPYRPRTAAVVANEKWIVWLNSLDPETRRLILLDELNYFDAFAACKMTQWQILEDVLANERASLYA